MTEYFLMDIDISKSTLIGKLEKAEDVKLSFQLYHEMVENYMKKYNGAIFNQSGDGEIFYFNTALDAFNSANELLEVGLVNFNRETSTLTLPISVRIGIHLTKIDIPNIPNKTTHKDTSIDITGKLQKLCPINKIAISNAFYVRIGSMQRLFRNTNYTIAGENVMIKTDRPIMHYEEDMFKGLTSKQRKMIPPMPFTKWSSVVPDYSLDEINKFFNTEIQIILGESNREEKSIVQNASTSDSIGILEIAASIKSNTKVRVGLDDWQDTSDYVSDRNLLVIGSGIVNVYSYCINEIYPIKYLKAGNRVLNQIKVLSGDKEIIFGHHGDYDIKDCGFIILSRNPFNIDKYLLWVSGITGKGTQAAAKCVLDLVNDTKFSNIDLQSTVGIVLCAGKKGVEDVDEYYKNWRVGDYNILYTLNNEGQFDLV